MEDRVEGGHVQESEHRRPCRTEDCMDSSYLYIPSTVSIDDDLQ